MSQSPAKVASELSVKDQIVMYQNTLEVRLDAETVWLNLNQMSELFHRDKSVVSRHIKNIFEEHELDQRSVVANFATTSTMEKNITLIFII